jgi:hypothetical protein
VATGQGLKQSQLLMSHEENMQWLADVKALAHKSGKWQAVSQRFLTKGITPRDSIRARYCPLLIIDGIPYDVAGSLTDANREQLKQLLTVDKIGSIAIVDKEPDGIYVNKPFSGIILVTLNDRKTRNKLRKLKLI